MKVAAGYSSVYFLVFLCLASLGMSARPGYTDQLWGQPQIEMFSQPGFTGDSIFYRYFHNFTTSKDRASSCFNYPGNNKSPQPAPVRFPLASLKYVAYLSPTYTGPLKNGTILYLYSTYNCPETTRLAQYSAGDYDNLNLRVASWYVFYPPNSDEVSVDALKNLPTLPNI